MTRRLIDYVLSLPQNVREALLAVDRKNPGWWVRCEYPDPVAGVLPPRALLLNDASDAKSYIESGDAWVPCNALAIYGYAIRLVRARFESSSEEISLYAGYTEMIICTKNSSRVFSAETTHKEHGEQFSLFCAIMLLEEVVAGV